MIRRAKDPPIADGRFGSKQGFTRRTSTRQGGPYYPQPSPPPPQPIPVPSHSPAHGLRIALVTSLYHEEILARCLLNHYWFCNKVFVVLGQSPDATEAIVNSDPRCVVQILNMPDGFRDDTKAGAQNDILRREKDNFDWFIVTDADEFVYPTGAPTCVTFREWLTTVPDEQRAIPCHLSNVYRHRDDRDLDLTFCSAPAILQRRHGVLKPHPGYIKPNVIRPGLEIDLGHHSIRGLHGQDFKSLRGSHWAWADPAFSITRTVDDRTNRQHPNQYKHNWGNGNYGQSYDSVRQKLNNHLDDPLIV